MPQMCAALHGHAIAAFKFENLALCAEKMANVPGLRCVAAMRHGDVREEPERVTHSCAVRYVFVRRFALTAEMAARNTTDWREATDPKTGRTYYYNKVTKATQWNKPLELATPQGVPISGCCVSAICTL